MAPVVPDGRPLVAVGVVHHRRGDVLLPGAEVTDDDGQVVAVVQGACLVRERGSRPRQRVAERMLLTVLFTDLVGSTERAQRLGDAKWRELLDEHNALLRRQLDLHRGREVNTTGDGFLATFDSPTRAVECARAMRDGLGQLGLEIRAGIHTGECELVGGDVTGLAVHVASRVQSAAQPGEILVSSTVRDLLGSSEARLVDRGAHKLKGLEGTWVLLGVDE
jgi:class 3 adenylate cyclase